MPNHILPAPLYKLVPLVYIGLGIYIYADLDTVFALISGSMLIGAGAVAMLMRRRPAENAPALPARQRDANGRAAFTRHPADDAIESPTLSGISVEEVAGVPPGKNEHTGTPSGGIADEITQLEAEVEQLQASPVIARLPD